MQLDLVLRDARVLTMDDARPRASAIGMWAGRVVGCDEEVEGLPARRVLDLQGATVVPGFNDAHNHLVDFGLARSALDLSTPPITSMEQLYDAVAAAARERPPGGWVIGTGYDQNKLGGAHPTRAALDRAAPDHRVWLRHTSSHMAVVNSPVLDAAGVADTTSDPAGGRIVRDADGRATGLLQEQAQSIVRDLVLPYPIVDLVDAIDAATRHYLSEGITSCTEAGIAGGWIGRSPVEAAAFQRARAQGRLHVRTTLMPSMQALHPLVSADADEMTLGLDLGLLSGFGDEWLRLGPVKVFADGSLLGQTAAMHEPFEGEPDNRGFFQDDEDVLREQILRAHASGWQVATHAIGDRAVTFALDSYAEAQRRWPRPDARHRIEHCGLTLERDLPRLAELGVIPVPQARFVGEIGDGLRASVGDRRVPTCYRFRSFLDAGLVLPGSSDRPVVAGAPLLGVQALVTMLTETGVPFHLDEALTVEEALRCFTLGSAYAVREEQLKGSVTAGKLADLTVLGDDPTAVDATRIGGIEVVATLVGGEVAYGEERLSPR